MIGRRPDPLAAMRANMRAFYRLLGAGSPQGSVFERPGVLAAIVSSCPARSYVNAVIYEAGEALAQARPELEHAYDEGGVSAWTVWVPEADRDIASLLERASHRLDGAPRAMSVSLRDAELSEDDHLEWERTTDVRRDS